MSVDSWSAWDIVLRLLTFQSIQTWDFKYFPLITLTFWLSTQVLINSFVEIDYFLLALKAF